MRTTIARLEQLEKLAHIRRIPTFEEFREQWRGFDPLSKSVFAFFAEQPETWRSAELRYMTAVRSHLLRMGEIDGNAQNIKDIAAQL